MSVDSIESNIYLACDNQNIYHFVAESGGQEGQRTKHRRVMQHKKKISAMTLTDDFLVSGDIAGLLYTWTLAIENSGPQSPVSSEGKSASLVNTMELHANKGAVTNLVAIQRPLSLFGLTANMAEYHVPQVQPLEKYKGSEPKDIEISFEPNYKVEEQCSEASLWVEMAN